MPAPGTPPDTVNVSTGASAGPSARAAPGVARVTRRTRVVSTKILRSFYFAFAGLAYLFRTQRNARIHLVLGTGACGVAFWLRISRVEWAVLVFTIALVLILEGLNTAVEAAIDLASPKVHPLAKAAKDLAAGMVLIAAIASVAVGLLILGPPLWRKVFP
jgi:diacylglycerol kinase